MGWVAVDKDGQEVKLIKKPIRSNKGYWFVKIGVWGEEHYGDDLDSGTIEKLIGIKLTWEDEPVELKEE